MVQNTMSGKHRYGFTLMELLIVLLLLSLLASLVSPLISKSIDRARESSLKEDLFILRKAIDDYYADKGQYPVELEVLVSERYIRKIPKDPVSQDDWQLLRVESDEAEEGIIDIQSRAEGVALDGTPYNEL